MKILFVVSALGAGGAEKIFIDLLKNIDYREHEITLLMFDHIGRYCMEIPKEVSVKYIFEHVDKPIWKRKIYGLISILGTFYFRKISSKGFYKKFVKEKYDVEIAFWEGDSTKLLSQSTNVQSVKYAWVHTDMIKNPWSEKCYKNFEEERFAYKQFNRVLAVSDAVRKSVEEKFGVAAEVVYNALDEKEVYRKANILVDDLEETKKTRLISVGRLEEVKGFPRLIEVFAQLFEKFANIELIIIGDGSQKTMLENLIKEKKLEGVVRLLGYKENPYPYIKSSDVFVCSSYAEGLSTVVTESLILGVPVITTECAGMYELLGDSVYGRIVDNSEEGLKKGLEEFLQNKHIQDHYRKMAIQRGKAFCVRDRIQDIELMIKEDLKRKNMGEKKDEEVLEIC